jgi:hypothetical protein
MATADVHAGKRRHRHKKSGSIKQEEQDGIASTIGDEHHGSSQIQ